MKRNDMLVTKTKSIIPYSKGLWNFLIYKFRFHDMINLSSKKKDIITLRWLTRLSMIVMGCSISQHKQLN
jgi:hypothetical protein